MNSRIPSVPLTYPALSSPAVREKPLDLRQLFRFLISNSPLIALLTGLFVLAALLYVTATPPTFVSSAQLMLDSQKTNTAEIQRTLAEEALVEGQMEIMKSGDVLQAVVRSLDLTSDPEFNPSHPTLSGLLRSVFAIRQDSEGTGTPESEDERLENRTIAALRSQLWVRRVGQSTVIEMSVASSEPEKSASIANALAEEYIAQNVRRKSQSAQQASEWLAQRVAELRDTVLAADRAVTRFQASGDPASQFKLTELKSVSATYRRLYETYLQSWSEAKQRISYPVSDATFVSRATVPVAKSQPRSMLLLTFALVLGISAGIVVAIIRHFSNRVVTSAERMTAETGAPCIGEVSQATRTRDRQTERAGGLFRFDEPGSKPGGTRLFDRDLRDLRATIGSLKRNRNANLIGLAGTESKAGTTTLAYNLALLAAAAGSKTLLIDTCAASPDLSRACGEEKAPGLMEALDDPRAYAAFMESAGQRLTVLPVGTVRNVSPGERIGSERIAFSFSDLKERFDLILVDLPSVSSSPDAKSIAPYLDGTIVVTRYGRSSFDTLAGTVDTLRGVGTEILGIVLNATPQRKK